MDDKIETVDLGDTTPPEDPKDVLHAKNGQRIQRMLADNVQGVDALVLQVRLNSLMDLLFPQGGPMRHMIDFHFEVNLDQQLDAAEADITRQKLLAP